MRAFRPIARSALYATAITPLVVASGYVFPFIEPKALWFRGCVLIALAAWLASCVEEKRWPPRLSGAVAALAVTTAGLALSDYWAPIPVLAFLSRPERSEGLVYFAHFLAFVFVANQVLETEKQQRRLFYAHVIASFVVGAIGYLVYVNYILMGMAWYQIYSTLGNPVFLGQYAALSLCLAMFLWVSAGKYSRFFLGIAAFTNFSMVYLSQGRGAALAVLAAGSIMLFTSGTPQLRRRLAAILGLMFLCLVVLPALVPEIPREAARRWTGINLNDPRFKVWILALEEIRLRPLFGWGQDGMLVGGGYLMHIDRAHNIVLDWLVQGGVFGLLAWSSFLGATANGIRTVFRGPEQGALWAFLAAYLITDLFLFDTGPTYILLGSMAAVVAARGMERAREPARARLMAI